jgi:hypothetical protein
VLGLHDWSCDGVVVWLEDGVESGLWGVNAHDMLTHLNTNLDILPKLLYTHTRLNLTPSWSSVRP